LLIGGVSRRLIVSVAASPTTRQSGLIKAV
jgi:hypothetical protein